FPAASLRPSLFAQHRPARSRLWSPAPASTRSPPLMETARGGDSQIAPLASLSGLLRTPGTPPFAGFAGILARSWQFLLPLSNQNKPAGARYRLCLFGSRIARSRE